MVEAAVQTCVKQLLVLDFAVTHATAAVFRLKPCLEIDGQMRMCCQTRFT